MAAGVHGHGDDTLTSHVSHIQPSALGDDEISPPDRFYKNYAYQHVIVLNTHNTQSVVMPRVNGDT